MRVFASVVLAAAVAMSPSLMAQWPKFTTPNVPRNADGSVNLAAPTPKTADGHTDFSGVWSAAGGGGGGGGRARGAAPGGAPGGAPPAAGAPAAGAPPAPGRGNGAAPAPGRGNAAAQAPGRGNAAPGGGAPGGGGGRGRGNQGPPFSEGPPVAQFFNIGQGLEGGSAPMTPWAADLKKQRLADNAKDNPDAHCLPIGFTQFHTHPQPRKILQTPAEVAIMYESNYGLREIYLDGRQAPPPSDQDVAPWWYGYTVGKWDGDALVATTTHIRDGMWLDVNGTPLTDQATVVERFRRPFFGNLEIDITITDPKAFTKPFTVRVNQRLNVDTDLIEFICNENEQSSKHYEK